MSNSAVRVGGADRASLQRVFYEYVATKVLKRLESNKIRAGFNDQAKTLLLPVSFGVSSIALLHVLDQQLRNRTEQGRHAGYKLHVLFVDQSMVLDEVPPRTSIGLLQQRFPSNSHTTISFHEVSDYGIDVGEMLHGARRNLKEVITRLPSATSKVDFIDTIRRRLILAYAERNSCDSILFGDSTTRLAEMALSETAKGRGIALPWVNADSDSSGITCIYPLRDVLRKELLAYANFTDPPLTSLIMGPSARLPTSFKDTTIDGLMSRYFESVEENYPSIVANVVRTSGKLMAPVVSEHGNSCSLCGNPIINGTWGGDQNGRMPTQVGENNEASSDKSLCYGCARTVLME